MQNDGYRSTGVRPHYAKALRPMLRSSCLVTQVMHYGKQNSAPAIRTARWGAVQRSVHLLTDA
jgi:hypothetical protein